MPKLPSSTRPRKGPPPVLPKNRHGKVYISTWVHPNVKQALLKLATADSRSLTGYVEIVLRRGVGHLEETKQ